jgi:hypothetical protein
MLERREQPHQKCNKGIKDWNTRWQLSLGSQRALSKALGKIIELEVVK